MKLKKLSKITKKITDGSHFSPEIIDFGYPYVTVRDVNKAGVIDRVNCKKISLNDFEQLTLNGCKPNVNDLLISKDGTIGKSAIVSDSDFVILSSLAILRFKKDFDVRYCYYWSISEHFMEQALDSLRGAALMRLTLGKISNFSIPFFNINTQNKIVAFLDENCSKIDTEIELLEKKSILLDEYKNALIYETVTKGLDKNAEMKNSGIDFIGIIPNHWKIKRIKDLFKISRGRVIAASTLEKEQTEVLKYPVFSAATENDGVIGYLQTYDFNNDVLTWTTDGAKAGAVFIRSGKFNCTNVCGVLQPKTNNNNLKFQKYALSIQTPNYQRPDINGAKIMSNEMAKILIVQPPLDEQLIIVDFLDKHVLKLEKEIELINKKVELLKEYKQSLIYEAVTGQLEIE